MIEHHSGGGPDTSALHLEMQWGVPGSPLQAAALVLMREAFAQALLGYQESPSPRSYLEWLDEDLRRLYYLARADPMLLPYRRLGVELQKGWLQKWVVAEIEAAVAAIDRALERSGPGERP